MIMNFIQSTIAKLILRHLAGAAGAWLIQSGLMSDSDQKAAGGALLVLLALAHSFYDKRAIIIAEVHALLAKYAPAATPAAKVGLLLIIAGGLAGCASNQLIDHTSVQGGEAGVTVPNPFGGGGVSFIEASMKWGNIKHTFTSQPTSTNQLKVASLAIADVSRGNNTVTGSTGTNAAAAIGAGSFDKYLLTSGDTVAMDDTNGTHLDGYQGFNPLAWPPNTNAPAPAR